MTSMSARHDADGPATNVWLRAPRNTRERAAVNRERIVEAAVGLLDREGAEGLTMRRLAEQLGTGSTTLYWHVETKDDVLDLAYDEIVGEIPLPDAPADDWRRDAIALAVAWRAAMLRHPWTAALLGRPLLGPNVLARLEFLQATLARGGLQGEGLQAATWALVSQVMGSAAAEVAFVRRPEEGRAARELVRAQRERYPMLAASDYGSESDWSANFVRGVEFLVEGLAAGAHPRRRRAPLRSAAG
jgi:AcrR family transcriptional regulator